MQRLGSLRLLPSGLVEAPIPGRECGALASQQPALALEFTAFAVRIGDATKGERE